MDYKVFKERVINEFLGHMPEDFAGYTVTTGTVFKVNRELDKLELIPPKGREDKIRPVLYVQDIYDHYCECKDFDLALDRAAFEMNTGYKEMPQNVMDAIMGSGKERIVMMLINTEQNRQLLEDCPHREFQDLSVVYRIVIEKNEKGMQSTLVNNGLAKRLEMEEEDLFRAAVVNTRRLCPPVVRSIDEIMKEKFFQNGMTEDMASMLLEDVEPENMLYVITNEDELNGAVYMLYEEELHKLAEQIGSDLYILPASIHEVLAVSSIGKDPYELAETVVNVNRDQVYPAERLSNQVYHYDKELREMEERRQFTPEELDIAKSVDLTVVAERLGFTVRKVGDYYTLKEMDSIRIYNRKSWFRWSREYDTGNNGGSQIDFLKVFAGMNVKEAVFWLLDIANYQQGKGSTARLVVSEEQKRKNRPFVLPPRAGDNRFIYRYLMQERMISKEVVDFFIRGGLIYEEKHYHNIVFKGNDRSGVTRFASKRGVFDKNGKGFKCDVTGNDKSFGFNVWNEKSTVVEVFEAAIDLMSYMDIYRDFESNKLALGMLSDAPLVTFLQEHPQITNIRFCLDNDEPGRKATEKFMQKYFGLGYEVEDCPPPKGCKDYNQWLQECRAEGMKQEVNMKFRGNSLKK